MKFKYTALDQNGKRYTGEREATDKFALYGELKTEGLVLIAAENNGKSRNLFLRFGDALSSVPTQDKILFARNLGSMITAGLSVTRGLTVLEKQAGDSYFASVIADLNAELKKGNTLSVAVKKYPRIFSNLFVSMIKAGEESGSLAKALGAVGRQMDNSYRLNRKIRGAMIYPAVIVSVMIIIGILMFILVVPSLTETFKQLNSELPTSTRIIIGISDFLKGHWFLSIVGLLTLVGGGIIFTRSPIGKKFWNGVVFKLPIIKDLAKETNSARLTRTLSSLLTAGVPFAEAIMITGEVVQNHYFREILAEARLAVEKGATISSVFARYPHLLPAFVSEMASVGEETGDMPEMLAEVADYYESDVDQRTKDLSTIIEPILMVVIGILVGFFAVSMIQPIYGIVGNIK